MVVVRLLGALQNDTQLYLRVCSFLRLKR